MGELDELHAARDVVRDPCRVPNRLHQSAVFNLVGKRLFLHDRLEVGWDLVPTVLVYGDKGDADRDDRAVQVIRAPEWDTQSIYYPPRQQPETSFPVWDKSGRLPEKSEVLGLIVGGEARAYPAEVLRQQPVLNDTLGGSGLVGITPGDRTGSRGFQRNGQDSPPSNRGGIGAAEVFVADSDGEGWRMDEDAGSRPATLSRG